MTQHHPITPPPELVMDWCRQRIASCDPAPIHHYVATQAARWGWKQCVELDAAWLEAKLQKARDEELEACCDAIVAHPGFEHPELFIELLRSARRPKPPSLKELALEALGHLDKGAQPQMDTTEAADTIRRALEQLPDDPA